LNKKSEIILVAAVANNNVLGKDNKLIWHLPADLKMFKNYLIHFKLILFNH
jgi:dihydrofolate reductase